MNKVLANRARVGNRLNEYKNPLEESDGTRIDNEWPEVSVQVPNDWEFVLLERLFRLFPADEILVVDHIQVNFGLAFWKR